MLLLLQRVGVNVGKYFQLRNWPHLNWNRDLSSNLSHLWWNYGRLGTLTSMVSSQRCHVRQTILFTRKGHSSCHWKTKPDCESPRPELLISSSNSNIFSGYLQQKHQVVSNKRGIHGSTSLDLLPFYRPQ